MNDTPPRHRPATAGEIRTRRGIATAPTDRAVTLLWRDAAGAWQAIPGQWRDENGWIADPVITGGIDLPAAPTHWCVA